MMTRLDQQAGDRDSLNEPQGKTAIITGASRGVGRDMAITLGGAGAHVVVNYAASEDAAAGVVDKMNHVGGQAILCRADVSSSTVAGYVLKPLVHMLGILYSNYKGTGHDRAG